MHNWESVKVARGIRHKNRISRLRQVSVVLASCYMYRSFRCHIQPGLGLTNYEAYFLRMCRDTSPGITLICPRLPSARSELQAQAHRHFSSFFSNSGVKQLSTVIQ
jgi:hypothetical protein